jgi:predicted enzyme related to lactoylglutathione lyase
MKVTGVDFITVPTQDFEKADQFYGDVLGLERSKQWGNMPAREFETGSLTIALMQSDAFGVEFERHSHPIALHVDDVAAAREELESKGIEFVADTMDSGVCHMAHFRDPDGNALMRGGAPPPGQPGGLGQRHLDVGQDRPLRARGHDRLRQPVHVHVGAPPVLALAALQRDQREDPVGAHELAVAEGDHAWVALGHRR